MSKLFDDDGTPTINLFWFIIGIILLICIIYYSLIRYVFLPGHGIEAWGQRGTVGDTFGAINALFAGAGFAGAIFVILLQRADLKRQQKESIEQEERQRQENTKQAEDFNKQLEQAKLQTQAIINQLGHYEKQTNAILEQLAESKEQTKAINEEAKESAKQTKELTRQIKLSIMPSFIVELLKEERSNDKTGVISGTYYEARVTNIGNGIAININFEDIPFKMGEWQNPIIKIQKIAFIQPKTSILISCEGVAYNPSMKMEDRFPGNGILSHIYSAYHENNPYSLKIRFQDIEGTKYEQTVQIGHNISIPEEVKVIK